MQVECFLPSLVLRENFRLVHHTSHSLQLSLSCRDLAHIDKELDIEDWVYKLLAANVKPESS